MAFKLNDGQIVLNSVPQQEGKKMPALKGKVRIFGISIPVVLWTKTTEGGKKWWSGHVGEDAPSFDGGNHQQTTGNTQPQIEPDDLPF